ncbi:MFS transporter [Kitasatospora sp. NPDC008115]|uniref:MFS transporter n=1 Tax=Kitasatospora sp. NPDC008115 TaxID=3364022 RepID=UPI0036E202CA
MSTTPTRFRPAVPTAPPPGPPGPARRLGPLLGAAHLGWMLPVTAGWTLLQALFERIDPDTKLTHYSTAAAAGAFTSTVAVVAFGFLSDRTRSRWGRRNPWILAGALAYALSVAAMSGTESFAVLLTLTICFQTGLNAMLAALYAVLPDRVPTERLGRASSWAGLGQLLGQGLGAVAGGLLVTHPDQGLRWLPWLAVLGALAFVRFAPDRPALDAAPAAPPHGGLLRSLLPPRDADYFWALVSRLLAMLGIHLVLVYQLFILTDHLGMSTGDAGTVVTLGGLIIAVFAGVSVAISGPLSDRVGRRKPFVVAAAVIAAAGLVPLTVAPALWSFLFFTVLASLGFGCLIAVDQAIVAEVLPDHHSRAKDLGFLNIANTAPQVLAPIIAGAVVPAFGYSALFVLAIAVTAGGGLAVLPVRRVR